METLEARLLTVSSKSLSRARREEFEPAAAALREALQRVVERVCPPWLSRYQDDLIQAVVLKVLEARGASGEGIEDIPSSYLYRAAHSALVDEIRRQRRRREVDFEAGGDAVELRVWEWDPEREAASRQSGRAIRDCLQVMKVERRWAVTLYLLGNSVPESARALGWTRKRTENLVFRGLMNLRQCLLKKGVRP